jgi:hypothetical protein
LSRQFVDERHSVFPAWHSTAARQAAEGHDRGRDLAPADTHRRERSLRSAAPTACFDLCKLVASHPHHGIGGVMTDATNSYRIVVQPR